MLQQSWIVLWKTKQNKTVFHWPYWRIFFYQLKNIYIYPMGNLQLVLIIIYMYIFTKLFIENQLLKVGNLFKYKLTYIYWAEIIDSKWLQRYWGSRTPIPTTGGTLHFASNRALSFEGLGVSVQLSNLCVVVTNRNLLNAGCRCLKLWWATIYKF